MQLPLIQKANNRKKILMNVYELREDDKKKQFFVKFWADLFFRKVIKKMKILVKRYYVHSVNYSL